MKGGNVLFNRPRRVEARFGWNAPFVVNGEEYPAVIGRSLGGEYRVVNLGFGGWGPCQEVRRYYDFGALFKPRIVVLQFCGNDPYDDIKYKVAYADGGKIVFKDMPGGNSPVKTFLAGSHIQYSQLCNLLLRNLRRPIVKAAANETGTAGGGAFSTGVTAEERIYIDLLDAFAENLNSHGVRLLMISVNGELGAYKNIFHEVVKLQSLNRLRYLEVADWLKNESDYAAPDGHIWGRKAHEIIGNKLAEAIRRETAIQSNGRPPE